MNTVPRFLLIAPVLAFAACGDGPTVNSTTTNINGAAGEGGGGRGGGGTSAGAGAAGSAGTVNQGGGKGGSIAGSAGAESGGSAGDGGAAGKGEGATKGGAGGGSSQAGASGGAGTGGAGGAGGQAGASGSQAGVSGAAGAAGGAPVGCTSDNDCAPGTCLLAAGECAPANVSIGGTVQRFESALASPKAGVPLRLRLPGSAPSTSASDGSFSFPNVPSLVPASIGARDPAVANASFESWSKVAVAAADVKVDIPVVSYAWLARIAYECGIFPDLSTATGTDGNVNFYFTQRSTVIADLSGVPLTGTTLSTADVSVRIGSKVNTHQPADDASSYKTHVCFVKKDTQQQYVAVSAGSLLSPDRIVVFRARNESGVGNGVAEITVAGLGARSIGLPSTGNIGIVRFADAPPSVAVVPEQPTYATDIDPILTAQNCKGCHRPGEEGYLQGLVRSGVHADFSGTTDEAYAALTSPDAAGCEAGGKTAGARVCLESPEASLILAYTLDDGSAKSPHPLRPFESTQAPGYRTILRWIEQGAKK